MTNSRRRNITDKSVWINCSSKMKAHKHTAETLTNRLGTLFILILFFSWTVPQSEAVPECYGKLDTIFVLDVSASVTDENIIQMRTFVNTAVDLFSQSIGNNFRMGLIWYATDVYEGSIIHLTENHTEALQQLENFDRTLQDYIFANTASALSKMESIFYDEGRLATWACILVTDSISTDPNATEQVAIGLEQTRIHVFPIGFGSILSIDQLELDKIATGTIQPAIVDDLSDDALADDITKDVCDITEVENTPNVTKDDLAFDMYFLLEESSQVLEPDYNIMKDFVKMIMRTFQIGELSAKVGVLNYASQVLPAYTISLGSYADEADFFVAVDRLNYNVLNQGRDLDSALQTLTQSINANSEPERPVVVLIFTSGPSENGISAIAKAQALKERVNPNVYFVVVGVAASDTPTWENERTQIATSPETALLLESFPILINQTGENTTFHNIRNVIYRFASGTEQPVTRWSAAFDLFFAVDGSGLVGQFFEFPLFSSVMEILIDDFELQVGMGRVGLALFDAAGTYTTLRLGNYLNREDLIDQIRSLVILNRTATADNAIALKAIREEFASNRRDSAKIGFLITMSGSSYTLLTQAHARAAAREGIQLIEVGVDEGVNQDNMLSLQLFEPVGNLGEPVVFTSKFLLGSDTVLDKLRAYLQLYAGIDRPENSPFPWKEAEFDLIIVLDDKAGRVSMGLDAKRFLNNLVSRYLIESDKVRVGVVTVGDGGLNTGPNRLIELGTRDNLGSLVLGISTLDLSQSAQFANPSAGPAILAGLNETIEMFDRNPRAGVSKLAFIMLGGTPADLVTLEDFNKLRDSGISALTLGVGETDPLVLESLAFNHKLSYRQPSWSELSITARMDADIIALSQGVFEPEAVDVGLRLAGQCSHPASIIFLIDLSDSIRSLLDSIKTFIGILLSGFDLSTVEIGLVGYSEEVLLETQIALGSITNYPQLFINFMMRMQPSGVLLGTRTGSAINFMRTQFAGTTQEKKIGIVVTDGVSINPAYTLTESAAAIAEGIKMIAIGVGADSDSLFMDELLDITGGNADAVFDFSSADFNDTAKLEDIQEYICAVAKPQVTCGAGTFYDGDTDSCQPCDRGFYQSLENEDSCIPCATGLTTPGPGATNIIDCYDPCENGETWSVSACIPCGFGFYRNKLIHNACQQCVIGFITISDTAVDPVECVPDCEPGHEWNVSMCTPCEIGFYQPKYYELDCLACQDQWTTLSPGAISCVPSCVEGQRWNASLDDCEDCPIGYYQPLPNQEYCETCLEGLITLNPGSTQPEDCTADCPNDDFVPCPVSPCDVATCPNYPEAECLPVYCGSCSAIYILPDGNEVTGFCKAPSCTEVMDLVLLVDTSDSIDEAELANVKQFLQTLIGTLDISPDKTRAAVVPIGALPLPADATHLDDSSMSHVSVSLAVHSLTPGAGSRNIAGALNVATGLVQTEGREDIPKLFLLITDGVSQDPVRLKLEASRAAYEGIDVMVVGIGPNLNQDELEFIAKNLDYVVTQPAFTDLSSFDLSGTLCEAAQNYEGPEEPATDLAGSCPNMLDMVILMDVSDSFSVGDITWMHVALLQFISLLDIGLDKIRIGVISYDVDVNMDVSLPLNESVDYAAVSAAIRRQLKSSDLGTNTGDGLMMALEFFEESRDGVPRILLIVTDGASNVPEETIRNAQIVQDNFIYSVCVGIGSLLDESEIQALATELESILIYDSTESWATSENAALELVDKVCPDIFQCNTPTDIAFVWAVESKEVMISGFGFVEELQTRYLRFLITKQQVAITDWTGTSVFAENFASIGEAVEDAKASLEAQRRSYGVSLIIILADDVATNPAALSLAVNETRNSGIIVAAINADSALTDDWNEYVSSPEVLFEVRPFDRVEYSSFILKSLCRVTCPSGSEVDSTLTEACSTCSQGTYRDSAVEYRCTDCSEGTTTVGPGSTGSSSCKVDCLAGSYWDTNTDQCEICQDNHYQPEPLQFDCMPCPAGSVPTDDKTACNRFCTENMDLVFLVDTSDSVDGAELALVKDFLQNLVSSLDVSPDKTRVAIVPMGTATLPSDNTHLNNALMSHGSVSQDILNLTPGAGLRDISGALTEATELVQTEGRDGIPKLFLLVTNGDSQDSIQAKLEASHAAIKGIDILVAGVGPDVNPDELGFIAKNPDYVVTRSTFVELSTLDLSVALCEAAENYVAPAGSSSANLTGACPNQLDIVILMDVSNSFTEGDITWMHDALDQFVSLLDIGLDKIRVGVISFDIDVNIDVSFPLNESVDYGVVSAAIYSQLRSPDPGTGTDDAAVMALEFFEDSRVGVPRILVTVTDEASCVSEETTTNTQIFKDNFIYSLCIGIGPSLDLLQIQALVTEPDSILTYTSAESWAVDPNSAADLADKVCPASFQCDTPTDAVFVWAVESKEVVMSALRFIGDLTTSFSDWEGVDVFAENFASVGEAVGAATDSLKAQRRSDGVSLMIIIHDDVATNPAALSLAVDDALNNGIIVAAINADLALTDDWNEYVSGPEVLFEVRPFDRLEYSSFILKSLCRASCPSGTEVDSTLTEACTTCSQGSYRDSAVEYRCTACSEGTTTEETGSTSSSSCEVDCLPGTSWNVNTDQCEVCPPDEHQPDPLQFSCIACPDGSVPSDDKTACNLPCTETMDLVLIVDTSLSVDETELNHVKNFLQNLILSLDIHTDKIRVAVSPIQSVTPLSDITHLVDTEMTHAAVSGRINSLIPGAGTRNTASAIAGALSLVELEGRDDSPKLFLLVTAGVSVNPFETRVAAAFATVFGVDIITVGVGPDINLEELEFIAKVPNYIVTESTFAGLSSVDLTGTLCNAAQSYELPPEPPSLECPQWMDLVILMDVSESFSAGDISSMQMALLRLVSQLDIGPEKIRVAVVSFDIDVNIGLSLNLSQSVDYAAVSDAISAQFRSSESGTVLGAALSAAVQFVDEARPDVPRILLTIMDGPSTDSGIVADKAAIVKNTFMDSVVVAVGSAVDEEEIQTVASSVDSIVRYDSTAQWVSSSDTELLNKICPEAFQCSAPMDIALVWDLESSRDSMVSSIHFSQDLTLSFSDVQVRAVFSNNSASLGEAVENAVQVLVEIPRTNTVKMVVVMIDHAVTDTVALTAAVASASASGVVVAAINADPNVVDDWSQYVLSPELVFEEENFDNVEHSWFILRSLCRDSCPSGSEVDTTLTESCSPCPKGTYRHVAGEYICTACAEGTSTIGPGATDSDSCVVDCQPGTFYNNSVANCDPCPCDPCPPGEYQPEPFQLVCQLCPINSIPTEDKTDCREMCFEPMDLVVLVDTSGSIEPDDFALLKSYLVEEMNRFIISPLTTRIAFGPIANETSVSDIDLNGSMTETDVTAAINSLTLVESERNIASALNAGRDVLVGANRGNVAKVIFLISAGPSLDSLSTKLAAAEARRTGIETSIMGLCGNYDDDEFDRIASKPELVFTENVECDFTTLPEVWDEICQVARDFEPAIVLPPLNDFCPDRLDIVFLMDVSESFGAEVPLMKAALVGIASQLDIGLSKIRIAVVSFGNEANEDNVLFLYESVDQTTVALAVHSQPQDTQFGLTDTAAGLAKALEVYGDSRQGIPKVLLTVTDGYSENPGATIQMAQEIQSNFIYSVLVGIGLDSGPEELDEEFLALATDESLIFLYDTAEEFQDSFQQVLDKMCPDSFTCDTPIDLVTIRDVEDTDVLASALNFRDQMKNSYIALNNDVVFDLDENTPLEEAVILAQTHFQLELTLEQLNQALGGSAAGLTFPATDSLHMILIITDNPIGNPSGLLAATDLARENGVLIAVINARTEPDVDWENYVSSKELLFEVDSFDSPGHSWFIQKSSCRASCPSGFEVDATLTEACTSCPKGTYRDSAVEYRCTACSEGTSTVGPESTSIERCMVDCQPGTFWNISASQCESCPPGEYQPDPFQVVCELCPANTRPTEDKTDCREICSEPLDLVVLVDTSDSTDPGDFALLKSHLVDEMTRFNINPLTVRIGFGPIANETLFSDIYALDGSMTEPDVVGAINTLMLVESDRNIASALNTGKDLLVAANRENAAKVIFVITTGPSSDSLSTKLAAAEARRLGIEGTVMGLCGNYDDDELYRIASKPELVFTENIACDFTTLPEVWNDICQIARDFEPKVEPPILDDFCPDHLDIVFLMDVSESFGAEIPLMKATLVNISSQLDIGLSKIRIAVVSFGNEANEDNILFLYESVDFNTVEIAVQTQPPDILFGLTDTAAGLAKALEVYDDSRQDIPKVLLTVTDGYSANPGETIQMAQEVQSNFIYSVLVGIGLDSGPEELDEEFLALATDESLIFLYDTAEEFKDSFQQVMDKMCPELFMCDTPIDLVTIRDVEDTSVLASALNFRDQMKSSYIALNDDVVFDLDENTPLEEAVVLAQAHFQLQQTVDQLNIDLGGTVLQLETAAAGLVFPATDSVHLVLIISDKLISNPSGLFAATKSARDNGILIAVINARTEPDVIWESYVSSKDLLFEVDSFDSPEYTWFIQKSCCRAQCVSGSEMGPLGACRLCQKGTFRDSESEHTCQACPAGFTTSSSGAVSGDACTDLICEVGFEFDPDPGVCEECPRGTYRSINEDQCTSCPGNFTTIAPRATHGSECVPDCTAGQEMDYDANICVDCEDGKFQLLPYMETPCIQCPATSPFNTLDRQGCKHACILGERWNKNKVPPGCNWCGIGEYNADPLAEECAVCPSDTTTLNIGAESLADCVPACGKGEKWTEPSCTLCGVNSFQDEPYPHGVTECIECPGDTMTTSMGSTSMDDCEPNCGPGTRWNPASALCEDCEPGRSQSAAQPHGIEVCPLCPSGEHQPSAGQADCLDCPVATPFSTADRTACFGACPIGHYYDQLAGSCADCPYGTYADMANSESCTDCPDGQTTLAEGSTSMTDCMTGCTPGQMMNMTTTECEDCPPGTFQPANEPVAMMCMDCPADQFQPDPGQAACLQCPCDDCPANAMLGTDDRTACKANCTAGEFYDQTSQTCEDCPFGTYSVGAGSESCTSCPDGMTTSSTGSTGPGTCTAGCKPGQFMVVSGNCVDCEAGTFQPMNMPGIQDTCMDCPAGSVSDVGSAECTTCQDSTPLASADRTTCIADCPRGSYFDSSTDQCEFCPSGTFQNMTGQESCIPCPGNPTEDRTRCREASCCIDLVIAVDLSRKLSGGECYCLREFLLTLIERLQASRECTRVGIIKFAKSPLCVIHLRDGFSIRRLRYQIAKQFKRKSKRSNVNACSALRLMNTMFAKERRRNVPLRGLLMMDEMSDNTAAAARKAEFLKSKGVGLTVVGTDQTEVETLATPGSGFVITGYRDLPSVDEVVDSLC